MKAGDLFIGYDVGTTGIKAVLINHRGHLVGSEFGRYRSSSRFPGWHEQDPTQWWTVLTRCTRNLSRRVKKRSQDIAGISLGVQGLGFFPVDSSLRPLRPCMTWLDSRGKRQAERITVETGEHVSAKHVAAKALWLKENETEAFKKADKFVDCGAFLITKMTGNFAWGFWNASWFGYDEQTRSWKFEDYGLAGDKLPMPIPTTGQAGETTNPAARQMGVRRGIPVIAGGSDVVAAYVGSGAIRPGSAHVYLGSSSWICLSSNSPVTPDESADFIIGRPFQHWVNIGESESACSCIDWLGQQLGILSATPSETEYLTMQKMAHEVSPGSGRLIFLPWMKGERAPIKDNNARGAFIGLTLSHTRQHMVRSIMEGVAYNNRWTLEKLESLAAVRISSLRAIGGGFRSRVWAQILADVMRKSVKVLEHPQYAGGVGAALIAALGVRAYKDIKELQDLTPVSFDFRPRESVSRIYDKLFTDFKQSYLKPLSDVYSCWGPA